MDNHAVWGIWVLAASLAACATWLSRTIALRIGFVNQPNPLVPQHKKPTAYMGGVGLFVGGGLAILILWILNIDGLVPVGRSIGWPILIPGTLYLILGLWDDWKTFSPGKKFLWQAIIALVAVLLGVRYPVSGIVLLDSGLSWFWILVLVNAVNFTDVCDGLVAGVSAVAFLCLAHHDSEQMLFAFCWSGACLGFLLFNRPPASIFLGDAGSQLLGYLLAAIMLTGGHHLSAWPYIGVTTLAAGVFLFELIFITAVRIRKGLPWWRGSPDHLSLRLQAGGFTKLQTIVIVWIAAILLWVATIFLNSGSLVVQVGVLGIVFVLLSFSWHMLLKMEVQRE